MTTLELFVHSHLQFRHIVSPKFQFFELFQFENYFFGVFTPNFIFHFNLINKQRSSTSDSLAPDGHFIQPLVVDGYFSFRDRRQISTLIRSFSAIKLPLSSMTRKITSNCISYVTSPLAKHKDDEASFTHGNKINDHSDFHWRVDQDTYTNNFCHRSKHRKISIYRLLDPILSVQGQ